MWSERTFIEIGTLNFNCSSLTISKMTAENKPVFDYHEETQSEKLARKSKESPFMIIGLAGLVTACGVGAFQFKRRGAMSTSVFLMQLRVIAQGSVVGALTAGVAYSLYSNYIKPKAVSASPSST